MNKKNTPQDLSYRSSGVNIDAGNELVSRIKKMAAKTARSEMLAGIGGFGALFELPLNRYQKPVLVSSTDGVGTKLKLAFALNQHDTIGIDLVAMCVNDIIVSGAEPLFFLDYFATGQLDVETASSIISGIAKGCEIAGAALVGGETAEMPGMYAAGEYDLAGFCVGIVEKEHIISGETVSSGDVIIGLASSGPHSNGYSLIRKVLEISNTDLNQPFESKTLGEILLMPTRIYVKPVLNLAKTIKIKAIAHITGGGLLENIPRVLPAAFAAHLDSKHWKTPAIFDWLKTTGKLSRAEMHRTFNCGIGMILCVAERDVEKTIQLLQSMGETATSIGHIAPIEKNQKQVIIHP